jgi:hypothetical protein
LTTNFRRPSAQKKLAISRQARFSNGELSEEEARRNAALVRWGSYFITVCGALLLIMWALGL